VTTAGFVRWPLVVATLAAAAGRTAWVLAEESPWLTLSAKESGTRTPTHAVWRVEVDAHGFGAFASVEVDPASSGVEVVGHGRVHQVWAGSRVTFVLRVRRGGAPPTAVTIRGARNDGAVVRHSVQLPRIPRE